MPGVSDIPSAPLDESLASFWEVGDELKNLDTPIVPPTLNCVLLRRLGASPFPEGRFPLIGLMATCYQLIGEQAIREDEDASDGSGDADA